LKTGFNIGGIQDADVSLVKPQQDEFVALNENPTNNNSSNNGPTTDTGVPLVDVNNNVDANTGNVIPTTDTGVPLIGGSNNGGNGNNMPTTDTGVPLVGGGNASQEPIVELEQPLIDTPNAGDNSNEPSLTPVAEDNNMPKTDTGVPLVDMGGSSSSNQGSGNNLQSFGFSSPSMGSIKEANASLVNNNSNESFAEPELLLGPAKGADNGEELTLDNDSDDSNSDDGFDDFN
jgi:hypothetical protein